MAFLNYFQLALIVVITCVIVGKAFCSWAATGVFPIVIGRGKGPCSPGIELGPDLGPRRWLVRRLDGSRRLRRLPRRPKRAAQQPGGGSQAERRQHGR